MMNGHIDVDGVRIAYELIGTGPQVAFFHALPFVSWYTPLIELLSEYSVLRCSRVVPRDRTGFTIDDDAALMEELLRHVGFDEAHVVGHSYGGLVALALGVRRSVRPQTIALLEPASSGLLPPDQAAAGFAPMFEVYRSEGGATAMNQFVAAVCGEGAGQVLDGLVPGAFGEAIDNADHFFDIELPAVIGCTLGEKEVRSIDAPVLNVVGADSAPRFVHGAHLIESWLPHSMQYTLPEAGHLLMAQNPAAIAERLQQFWRSDASR